MAVVACVSTKAGAARTMTPAWGGVLAMSLGTFTLVASEFMPVSLLTPIAADLRITEGVAGQAISVSGAFALLTSLFISSLAGKLDRKWLLLGMSLLMIVSATIAAFAPDYTIFMIGRAFIGVAIGGFWSMCAATAMRLVPHHQIPKALAIVNGGNALATVIAAPLGSYLGDKVGWRGAFFFLVPIATIAFGWKLVRLPSMPAHTGKPAAGAFILIRQPVIAWSLAACSLFFMGQFTLFTYLRPFLEIVTHVGPSTLSLLLLTIGIAGFIGSTLIGALLKEDVYPVLIIIPIIMATVAIALMTTGTSLAILAPLLAIWGLVGTAAPVAWWTWLARTLPNDAEAGGGLMVAVIQLAITAGATVGGILFDAHGYQATFGASAAILALATLFTVLAGRASRDA